MIFHPAILALLIASFLIVTMAVYSSFFGVQILRHWDIQSGSEKQLLLERRTYLISTLLAYLFGFQLVSLFLFVFTADEIRSLFTGAMCAAGSFNLNRWGYPALLLKAFNFILAGLWLILNYADNRAYNYPLIRKKYFFLVLLTPFLAAEAVLQAKYFFALHPDIITSCCGSLFSTGNAGLGGRLAALPEGPSKIALFAAFILTAGSGILSLWRGKGIYFFAIASGIFFLFAAAGIVSFVSIYVYELPAHHCPFCILHSEYQYIGYPIYVALFAGVICGIGTGVLAPFRHIESLKAIIPRLQKNLTITALILFSIFIGIVVYILATSGLIMEV
ncbi:MAG: hypothetical protein EG826_00945 [Deltaproteobacteria bacterium]|nr:hypothetical protein [Deltaproteobacteria bacterium]